MRDEDGGSEVSVQDEHPGYRRVTICVSIIQGADLLSYR